MQKVWKSLSRPFRRGSSSSHQGKRSSSLTAAASETEASDARSSEPDTVAQEPPADYFGRSRKSISAPATQDILDAKQSWSPPDVAKSPERAAKLKQVLQDCFLFSAIPEESIDVLVRAARPMEVEPQTTIVRQGDHGDELFVIEEGLVEIFKKNAETGKEEKVYEVRPNDMFGELALLYSQPRAATAISACKSALWCLDSVTFYIVVREATLERRNKWEGFLKDVPILRGLTEYERNRIADVLQEKQLKEGDCVVRQDETGNDFYLLVKGTAEAYKNGVLVQTYGEGDYFGELAILRKSPRAATVKITSNHATVASVSRSAFTRMMGSLSNIMRERAACYEGIDVSSLL